MIDFDLETDSLGPSEISDFSYKYDLILGMEQGSACKNL